MSMTTQGPIPVIVAWDPGLRTCGVSIFWMDWLIWAGLIVNTCGSKVRGQVAWDSMADAVQSKLRTLILPPTYLYQVAYENPQDYKRGAHLAHVRTEDIEQLRGVNNAILKRLKPKRRVKYHPHDWKGSIDKDVMTRRIVSRLRPEERLVIQPCAADLIHNVYDGVGVGMTAVGRRLI